MGKSLVLKDERNRPGGYVIATGRGAICRAQVDGPWQLMLLFAGGARKTYEMAGNAEQELPRETGEICGACVIGGDTVLLASDERARMEAAFLQMTCSQRKEKTQQTETAAPAKETERSDTLQDAQSKPDVRPEGEMQLPMRRWPPPPCWESAVYIRGCWQEGMVE